MSRMWLLCQRVYMRAKDYSCGYIVWSARRSHGNVSYEITYLIDSLNACGQILAQTESYEGRRDAYYFHEPTTPTHFLSAYDLTQPMGDLSMSRIAILHRGSKNPWTRLKWPPRAPRHICHPAPIPVTVRRSIVDPSGQHAVHRAQTVTSSGILPLAINRPRGLMEANVTYGRFATMFGK